MKPPLQESGQAGASSWNRVQKVMPGENKNPAPKSTRVQYLTDGQTLDFNGDKIQAFSVPGHTYDSCVYLAFGALFMGDSAAGQYNGQIGSAPPFVSVDRKLNQRELKKLAGRLQDKKNEIDYLTFGHQGPIKGFGPLLLWASSH
jgi:glyoxylase-like metal-dependent hydrolase (beta-lactamase superfamily II)